MRLGLKGRAVYRWERGDSSPTRRHRAELLKIIQALNPQAADQLDVPARHLRAALVRVFAGLREANLTLAGAAQLLEGRMAESAPRRPSV